MFDLKSAFVLARIEIVFSTILKIREGGKTTFLKRKLSECVRRNENFCDRFEGVYVRFLWHLAVFEKNALSDENVHRGFSR